MGARAGGVECLSPTPQRTIRMTSQGTAHGRFTRAVASGNLSAAELAARELRWLSLEDALALCVLFADRDPGRFERAALRWLARLLAERSPSLEQLGLAVSALASLPHGSRAASTFTLRRLCREV
jgi:hypothetical protein